MNADQAIETLREFRMLRLGPELSEAIDCVVAEHERRVLPMAPKHNMVDAAALASGADTDRATGLLAGILAREEAQRKRLERRLEGQSQLRGIADLDAFG